MVYGPVRDFLICHFDLFCHFFLKNATNPSFLSPFHYLEWQNGCKGPAFDMSLVEDLLGELDQLWPTCSGSDNSTQFWGHEWSKHGTCSGLPEHGYFETALALATKYRSQCTSGGTCGVCFEKDLKTVMPCSSSLLTMNVTSTQ